METSWIDDMSQDGGDGHKYGNTVGTSSRDTNSAANPPWSGPILERDGSSCSAIKISREEAERIRNDFLARQKAETKRKGDNDFPGQKKRLKRKGDIDVAESSEQVFRRGREMNQRMVFAAHVRRTAYIKALEEQLVKAEEGKLERDEAFRKLQKTSGQLADIAISRATHPDIAVRLRNLGGVLERERVLDEAESLARRRLILYQRIHGEGAAHPIIAESLQGLSEVLETRGSLNEAEALYRESLTAFRLILGENLRHLGIAASLHGLGRVLQAKGVLDEAESLHREGLEMRLSVYGGGTDHPGIAASLDQLGSALELKGDLDGAKTLYRSSLCMKLRIYGEEVDHRGIADTLFQLGSVLKRKEVLGGAKGGEDQCLILLQRALTCERKRLKIEECLGKLQCSGFERTSAPPNSSGMQSRSVPLLKLPKIKAFLASLIPPKRETAINFGSDLFGADFVADFDADFLSDSNSRGLFIAADRISEIVQVSVFDELGSEHEKMYKTALEHLCIGLSELWDSVKWEENANEKLETLQEVVDCLLRNSSDPGLDDMACLSFLGTVLPEPCRNMSERFSMILMVRPNFALCVCEVEGNLRVFCLLASDFDFKCSLTSFTFSGEETCWSELETQVVAAFDDDDLIRAVLATCIACTKSLGLYNCVASSFRDASPQNVLMRFSIKFDHPIDCDLMTMLADPRRNERSGDLFFKSGEGLWFKVTNETRDIGHVQRCEKPNIGCRDAPHYTIPLLYGFGDFLNSSDPCCTIQVEKIMEVLCASAPACNVLREICSSARPLLEKGQLDLVAAADVLYDREERLPLGKYIRKIKGPVFVVRKDGIYKSHRLQSTKLQGSFAINFAVVKFGAQFGADFNPLETERVEKLSDVAEQFYGQPYTNVVKHDKETGGVARSPERPDISELAVCNALAALLCRKFGTLTGFSGWISPKKEVKCERNVDKKLSMNANIELPDLDIWTSHVAKNQELKDKTAVRDEKMLACPQSKDRDTNGFSFSPGLVNKVVVETCPIMIDPSKLGRVPHYVPKKVLK